LSASTEMASPFWYVASTAAVSFAAARTFSSGAPT
jgi:hypothetical protein